MDVKAPETFGLFGLRLGVYLSSQVLQRRRLREFRPCEALLFLPFRASVPLDRVFPQRRLHEGSYLFQVVRFEAQIGLVERNSDPLDVHRPVLFLEVSQ